MFLRKIHMENPIQKSGWGYRGRGGGAPPVPPLQDPDVYIGFSIRMFKKSARLLSGGQHGDREVPG